MNDDITRLAAVTADENGEHPGDVEEAAGSLSWTMDEDGSRWRAELPDGRSALITRLKDGDEDGNGASFLPTIHESADDFATGPICAGLLGAMAWTVRFAAENMSMPVTAEDRLEDLADDVDMLSARVEALAANSFGRDAGESLVELIYKRAYEQAHDQVVGRVDALEVRIEEIENAMRDVLVLAPYLRTFSERVTVLEERAGHPYAA
jgi:hypothetical protein